MKLFPVFVDNVPENKEPGILYISMKYMTSIHLCPCGCGQPVVCGLQAPGPEGWGWSHGWQITIEGDLVTLSPSILLMGGCRSHYVIRKNEVVWCR